MLIMSVSLHSIWCYIWCFELWRGYTYPTSKTKLLYFHFLGQRLMMISFLQRRCHPVTRCIKKIADQPCYNAIFLFEHRTHILKKVYACVYHLLKSIARLLHFRLQISSACFYNQNKFFLNCFNTECKFFILLTM